MRTTHADICQNVPGGGSSAPWVKERADEEVSDKFTSLKSNGGKVEMEELGVGEEGVTLPEHVITYQPCELRAAVKETGDGTRREVRRQQEKQTLVEGR